jgi:4-hydroxyphenylacetate 3-monooxygenase
MGCITGKEYLERIGKLKTNVWLNGTKVKVSECPSFKGILNSQAKLYDIQNETDKKDFMTYTSPSTGDKVGTSFMQPKTKDDLLKRRKTIQEWALSSGGLMGRSPDYMNTIMMTFGSSAEMLSDQDKKCAENMRQYYEYCRENDLSLTHTFVQPQVDRSSLYFDNPKNIVAARMVDKNKQGIVIHGARLLATQGGITDEILVFPSGAQLHLDDSFSYAFAIPSDTPNLKFVCRESFDYGKSHYDHPLGSRYDEIDSIVIFDHVTVPWDRVFLYGNISVGNRLYSESGFFEHTLHQVVSRSVIKTEFILGILQLLVDTINISEYQHVQEKISEVIVALETMRSFLISSEEQAKLNQWGVQTPDSNTLLSAMNYFPRMYPRFMEIIQLLGASGLMSIPTEKDFESELKEDLKTYLQSSNTDGYKRVKLFRLAWDLSMSAFGTRQTLYERFFFGDPIRLAGTLYSKYDRSQYVNRVKKFLDL